MKLILKTFFLIILLISVFYHINGTAQLNVDELPFKHGEELKYRVHYGLINAGEATITIDNKFHTIKGSECFRVNVYGRTTGAFDWVIRVRDTWRTYIDKNTLAPAKFVRHIEEGNYYTQEIIHFDHQRLKAHVKETKREGRVKRDQEYDIFNFTQDIVSGFYFIRTLDLSAMDVGHLIPVNAFFEDSTYVAQIKYLGKETIKTKFGKKKSYVFTPIIPDNEFFEHGENTILVYFSADRNKIPLKIKAQLFIGSVECDIKGYKGLRERL